MHTNEQHAPQYQQYNYFRTHLIIESRDSSVGIALGYGLYDRGSRVRFPTGAGNFSHDRVKNGSGSHPASYPIGTTAFFHLP
jgi:hypothetical protein